MPGMTASPVLDSRPLLQHEKTPDRPAPSNPRPHPHTGRHDDIAVRQLLGSLRREQATDYTGELALARLADDEIGPRRPGAIYQNVDGRFEALTLITDPREAATLLRRDSARWAVIVRDTLRPDGIPFAVGSVWTTSDYLIRPAKTVYTPAA